MNAAMSVFLVSSCVFQAAAQSAAGSVSELLSPRAMAAANPDLTDEVRGDIMMARKMYRDAIDFYKPQASKVAAMANKAGIAYHQLGDLENAKKFYERAAKLNKGYAEALNNLGTVYYAKKSYGNAIKQYQKALAIRPDSPSILTNLGTAYLARKKYPEALHYYQEALALDPEVFEHRGTGGVLLQERSVEEKAMFYYTLAKSYAQAGHAEYTLRYVRFALENGFKERKKFIEEPVFAFLQTNTEFMELLAAQQRVL